MKLWLISYMDGGQVKTAVFRGDIWGITEACNRNNIPVCNVFKIEAISSEPVKVIY